MILCCSHTWEGGPLPDGPPDPIPAGPLPSADICATWYVCVCVCMCKFEYMCMCVRESVCACVLVCGG